MIRAVLIFLTIAITSVNGQEVQNYLSYAPKKPTALFNNSNFVAGDTICLKFSIQNTTSVQLVIKNTLGQSLLSSEDYKKITKFCLPPSFSKLAGRLYWFLIEKGKELDSGSILIKQATTTVFMESYFGPRQLSAGEEDYSMLVHIPTDLYDNVLPNGTEVKVNTEFLDVFDSIIIPMEKHIAWINIGTTNQSGRIIVSSQCHNFTSAQLVTKIYPAMPVNFTISSNRHHSFADGNEILELSTSKMLDIYGNTIVDGTLITFSIKDALGILTSAVASTINGVATAHVLHPEQPTNWNITAYVAGAVKSNNLSLSFQAAVTDYEIFYDNKSKLLGIGPILSFIDQKVADGFGVFVRIRSEENFVNEEKFLFTKNGETTVSLEEMFYPNGSYTITVISAGIEKELKLVLGNEK